MSSGVAFYSDAVSYVRMVQHNFFCCVGEMHFVINKRVNSNVLFHFFFNHLIFICQSELQQCKIFFPLSPTYQLHFSPAPKQRLSGKVIYIYRVTKQVQNVSPSVQTSLSKSTFRSYLMLLKIFYLKKLDKS